MLLKLSRLAAVSLAVLGLSVGAPTVSIAQTTGSADSGSRSHARFEAVRRVIQQTLQEANVPSIAVAVVQDGQIVWEEAFGYSDRERQIPATPHTPYSLASMTKPITATAVMQLHEAGRLDVDAPIERYLGGVSLAGYAFDADQVTARRIMSHSAGLPQYGNFYLDGSAPAGSEQTISRFGMVVFPPNTRFEYSNIGMKILDAAIARTSGLTYGEYLRREVFGPLGMSHSAVGLPGGAEAAVRYDNDRHPMRMYMTDHPGSGDVWASAHDMARFLAFHMGTPLSDQEPILSPETRMEMQRPASVYPMPTPPDAPRRDIGANWILTTSNGHPQIWHSGGQPGVSSVMAFFPEQKVAFVLLANSSAPLGPIGQAIREAIAPELLEQTSEPSPAAPQPIPFRGRWVGTVTSHTGQEPITLSFQESGEVTVQLGDQAGTTLAQPAFENGAFTGRFSGFSNIPEAARASHGLSLKVVPVEGELAGQLVAQGMDANAVFMLPGFVRLRPEGAQH
ncbi:MAG: beta-lactamase family protein [Caulobacterales bacterium]|nr:beta-lactamase family protein [Caulobacterales bacterium]